MIYARPKSALFLCIVGVLLTVAMTACSKSLSEAVTVLGEDTPAPEPSEATGETTALADSAEPTAADAKADAPTRPEGWSEETHSNDAAPNYDVVFSQDQVNQITITIAPEDWEAMQENMVQLFGEAGADGAAGAFPRDWSRRRVTALNLARRVFQEGLSHRRVVALSPERVAFPMGLSRRKAKIGLPDGKVALLAAVLREMDLAVAI